jgi:hypothetical protein
VHPLAVRLSQALLTGLLLPWMVYRLTRRLFPSHPPQEKRPEMELLPLLAALLAAIYLYFVLYAAMVQTEALYIVALVWSLERAIDLRDSRKPVRSGLTLGLTLGIATLFRQSILPWVAVLFAWLLWAGWRSKQARAALFSLAAAGLVLLACIAPFTIRNYRAYGDFLLLNSNAGYAMNSAQHPMHGTSFREFDAAPLPEELAGRNLNEAQWDKELMRRGIGFVIAEPGRYLLLSLSRVRDFFEFWPTKDSSLLFNLGRVLSFGLFLPFMLYGMVLAIRRARAGPPRQRWTEILASPLGLALLFMAFYSLLHIFTWAMPRYRLPVDAVALPFAALAMVELAERVPAVKRWAQRSTF